MYALNNPLRFVDPSGYKYGPTPDEREKIQEGVTVYSELASKWSNLINPQLYGNSYLSNNFTSEDEAQGNGIVVDVYYDWRTGKTRNVYEDPLTGRKYYLDMYSLGSKAVSDYQAVTQFAYRRVYLNDNGGDGIDIQHETQAYARLTDAERELARNNQGAALIVYRNMNRATDATRVLFPGARAHNDAADAFRHAYFSSLNARALGYDLAFQFGVAHEQFPGNSPIEMQMDLSNNIFGYNLTILYPNMSKAQLQDYIYNAVLSGELQMIYQGGLVPTR